MACRSPDAHSRFAVREAFTVTPEGTRQVSTINGWRLISSTTIMANVPRNVAQTLLPGTTVCECDYTRWGFWSTDSRRTAAGRAGTRADWGHLMTWVAGQMPKVSEVPSSGVATYTGHVVANVSNAGNQYVAAGNLLNTIDFGTRSGSAQVSNFDGANYSGTLLLAADPRYLGAQLNSNVANRTMYMTGNLFRGAQSPVGEMGGNVLVGGPNYLGSGIFAGRMR